MKIYNSLTRNKDEFKPINENKVGVYVCGITAYDSCHLGHARGAISFDIITRWLRHKGYDVTFVKNYTDIDDKIIKRANEAGTSCKELSEKFIEEYKNDMASLGNLSPDLEPKATEHIKEMIETISKLIKNGYAYEKNGDVFFSVRKFEGYGKLSGKKIDELESGARINVNESKEDPLDFALWKASKPGEPKWQSPWGEGRPGWHIECSAMSSKYLGQPFDIHGGGRDLVFPHHENEIAQAEGAEKKHFVNYWLHNGFININAEKMSKSLGNIKKISEIVANHGGETIRYFIISNHYRSPIDYTEKAMSNAEAALDRFYETAKRLNAPTKNIKNADAKTDIEKELKDGLENIENKINEFMDDDFNTAGSFGAVFELVRTLNRYLDTNPKDNSEFHEYVLGKWQGLAKLWNKIFGVFGTDPAKYFEEKKGRTAIDSAQIEALLEERKEARAKKDFARADEIRNQLSGMGITIKDRPDGTTEWSV